MPAESGQSTRPVVTAGGETPPVASILEVLPEGSLPAGFARDVAESRFPLITGDVALRKGEYGKAAVAFADAARRHPKAPGPNFALGDALVGIGQFDRAARFIRIGLERAPRWADSLDRSRAYGLTGDHKKHLEAAAKHARELPANANAWFLLGYLRMTSGIKTERDRAARAFERVLSIDPDDEVTLRFLRRGR
jgi:cytochrome c-type biogenesis protein CcmH/NrfG